MSYPLKGTYTPTKPDQPGNCVVLVRMTAKPESREAGAYIKLVQYVPKG